MGQSNAIFAALLIAFLVFITARGELPSYIDLFRGGGQVPSGMQQTSVGLLPTTVDGVPLIVTSPASPSSNTNDPVSSLLNNPSAFGIPQIGGIF